MRTLLKEAFSPLGGVFDEIPLRPFQRITFEGAIEECPLGECLRIRKRENANTQIFLGGHMDTVFSEKSPFQKARWKDKHTLIGPGAADMKGGLLVMLQTLAAFERHPLAKNIGWEVFINTDEEIGSPGSRSYFESAASRFKWGLIFEPAFPDGAIAGTRKGSLTLYASSKGKSAHAGRDFEKGLNAITPLCRFALKAEALTDLKKGLTVNVGRLQGGGSLNVVPDFALAGINIRLENGMEDVKKALHKIAKDEGITLHEHSSRPPRPLNPLFKKLETAAKELNDPLVLRETGGTCDGNLLAAYGLDTIDALGPIGGELHTENEYLKVDSIPKRVERATNLLIALAREAS